jgi:type VI secretion system secreted protein VgrG
MTWTTVRSTIQHRQAQRARARIKEVTSTMIKSTAIAAVGIAFVIAIGAAAGRTANAATPTIGLGTAAGFSVLAHTTVTNTGPTTLDRALGIDAPLTSVTGFPPGLAGGGINAGDAVAGQAKLALTNAYIDAAGRGSTSTQGALGGLTLPDGVYALSSLTVDLVGNLTLDGQGDPSSVWVFKAPSTLITASASSVTLINSASACNVFWQVSSSATLGTGSLFVGTILALTDITVTTGVTVDGRALARNGQVSLDTDTFISSACSQPAPIPPTRPPFTIAPSATPTVAPTATPIGTPAPTATPIGAATPAVAPTATPGAAATPTVAVVQTLPSTNTSDPVNPLLMLVIALAGVGTLVVRRQTRN